MGAGVQLHMPFPFLFRGHDVAVDDFLHGEQRLGVLVQKEVSIPVELMYMKSRSFRFLPCLVFSPRIFGFLSMGHVCCTDYIP